MTKQIQLQTLDLFTCLVSIACPITLTFTHTFTKCRLINESLASVQAEACARIVNVASSSRGRAWVFRHAQGNSAPSANSQAWRAGAETDYFDEWSVESESTALKSFWNAWRLNSKTERN